MRIAHISDLHVTAAPGAPGLVRADATARARALMADLAAFPGLDLVVATGDMVNDAQPAEYAVLAEVLDRLPLPAVIVPGNHDDRAALRALVPDRDYAAPDRMDHVWQQGPARVIALDSLSPGEVGGRLRPAQLDWLAEMLARPFEGRTLIALHHPPCPAGMGRLDGALLLEGAARLRGLLDALPRPATLLCGHLHRPFSARFGRAQVFAAASTAFQFALALEAPEEPPVLPEPFSYDIHVLGGDGGHVVHRRFPTL